MERANTSLLSSVQWVPGLRRPEHEAGPPTSEFMCVWSYKVIQNDTKKRELLKNPTKIEEIQEK